ncbi:hypothetical protein DPM19_07020 [Actinomadura craniellae]|uniref:Uncharacterized protein n=1 Tax=Actinomadura craniellae TaxID=2231787 RepID=A0A365HA11_9ACTN|nr:hypothetical protein DPM19_07020 [Actinomadura craniellae]
MRAAALALVVLVTVPGCRVLERISENAYLNAVASGATAELDARGHPVAGRLDCALSPSGTVALRVGCTGRTAAGRPVAVVGTVTGADTARPRERYVVTVGGREVLRTTCLGAACPG